MKIDFKGYKYAITRDYKEGELYLFNDLEVTDHGFKTGPFIYGKKVNTLHDKPRLQRE